MPAVDSIFLKKVKGAYKILDTASCCAFLFYDGDIADTYGGPVTSVITGYETTYGISKSLLTWWVAFLKKVGLPVTYKGVHDVSMRVIKKKYEKAFAIRGREDALANRVSWKSLPVLRSTVDFVWFRDGQEDIVQEFYDKKHLRGPEGVARKDLFTTRKVPMHILEYPVEEGIPQNLFIHTALRYAWHGEGIRLIKACKKLSKETSLTPYQILIVAHHLTKLDDYDCLLSPPVARTVPYARFLLNLTSPYRDVQGCLQRIPGYQTTGKMARKAIQLLRDGKYQEYFGYMEVLNA
jgi:hypothetical protein